MNIYKSTNKISLSIVFVTAVIFLTAGASVLKGHSRAELCDNCPYSQLCDEAVVEGGLPLCEDPRHRDKFYVNEKGDLVARRQTSEIGLAAAETSEALIAGGTLEAAVRRAAETAETAIKTK